MVLFSFLGWKSKGLKSKGHFKSKGHPKSKGLKAFKGTKAKSYIHKGLVKRSAEPWGHSLKGDPSEGFCWKGHSLKGNCRIHVGWLSLLDNYLVLMVCLSKVITYRICHKLNVVKISQFLDQPDHFADLKFLRSGWVRKSPKFWWHIVWVIFTNIVVLFSSRLEIKGFKVQGSFQK